MASSLAPLPTNYNISQIRTNLFQPALTSNFEVYIPISSKQVLWEFIKAESGFPSDRELPELLLLSCSEASLPGSSLATHELNNDVTGVTQRYAYRRLYDDRVDFTFYVTADAKSNYSQIKVFERWIQYIAGESNISSDILEEPYRAAWPDDYKITMYITKFERNTQTKPGFGKENSVNGSYVGPRLEYSFFNTYPISISSMPVSYDSSSLLKCTVSFTYDKYVAKKLAGKPGSANQPSQTPATGVPDVGDTSSYWKNNGNAFEEYNSFQSGIDLERFGLNPTFVYNTAPSQNNQQPNPGGIPSTGTPNNPNAFVA